MSHADRREARVHELRAPFVSWAFSDAPAIADSLLVGDTGRGHPVARVVTEDELSLCASAESHYRKMLLRDYDLEFCTIAERAIDSYAFRQSEAREAASRYWVLEDERSARESLLFLSRTETVRIAHSGTVRDLLTEEQCCRSELEREYDMGIRDLMSAEPASYLQARRGETRMPIPAMQSAAGREATATAADRVVLNPKPPQRTKPATKLSLAFVADAERRERLALIDSRQAFVDSMAKCLWLSHGVAPVFHVYAIERDEDIGRRAIASAYFDMLCSACRILEVLHRRQVDHSERRKDLARLVPIENQAWLAARQKHTRRHVVEEVAEIEMEQHRRNLIWEREKREAQQRRSLEILENDGRIGVTHSESSERAIMEQRFESGWRAIREVEISEQLLAEQRASTLVWTDEAYSTCILDERRSRQQVYRDEADERRRLRSDELSMNLNVRRAEALNIDVARSLRQNYDDPGAAIAQEARM